MNARDRRLYKFVDDLVRICTRETVAGLGVTEQAARNVAQLIANAVCMEYARFHIYVPAALELALDPRNDEIWRKYGEPGPSADGVPGARPFTPARIAELATEYQLTDRQIYSIVSAMRARETASRQGTLPGIDPAA